MLYNAAVVVEYEQMAQKSFCFSCLLRMWSASSVLAPATNPHWAHLYSFRVLCTSIRCLNNLVRLENVSLQGTRLTCALMGGVNLTCADLSGANLTDADLEGVDLRNANFTNALLMESSFSNTQIEGADFTNAVVSRIQQKQLCLVAKGTNPKSGIDTSYSLGCMP